MLSFPSNAVVMRTGSGDYPFICPHLVRALSSRGLWTDAVRGYLQRSRGMSPRSIVSDLLELMLCSLGSIQLCPGIPDDLKAVYRTMWDIDPVDLIDMAADRAPFVDQSQSLTLGVRRPTPSLMVGFVLESATAVWWFCVLYLTHHVCRNALCCTRGWPA